MLTSVERVLILKGADLLSDVGPRHLLGLAEVARESEIAKGDTIYNADDAADALYMVVEGRVRLSTEDKTMSEVGPGEAFGTWSLVDESARGHRAECVQDGLLLALHRDDFYDVAAGDLTLLQVVVRALARRLRALVAERPEEARVESEGVEPAPGEPEHAEATGSGTQASAKAGTAPGRAETAEPAAPLAPGTALAAAALGRPVPETETLSTAPEPLLPAEDEPLNSKRRPGTKE